jgi:hypothetical protein
MPFQGQRVVFWRPSGSQLGRKVYEDDDDLPECNTMQSVREVSFETSLLPSSSTQMMAESVP